MKLSTILDKIDDKFRAPSSPNQAWENGAFGISRGFIFDFGGMGVCCSILFCPRSILDETDHHDKFRTPSSPSQGWENGASLLSRGFMILHVRRMEFTAPFYSVLDVVVYSMKTG